MYEARYPSKGDPVLANHILDLLSSADIKAQGVRRGLDHGVWAGFHVGGCERDSERLVATIPNADGRQHSIRLKIPSTYPWFKSLSSSLRTQTNITALGRPSLLFEMKVLS